MISTNQAKYPHLVGRLLISSSLPLEQVAQKISNKLNLSLEKDIYGTYDEVPAYFTTMLGLRIAVMELKNSQNYRYIFNVYPVGGAHMPEDMSQIAWVDLGPWLEGLFQEELDFKVQTIRRPLPPTGDNTD